MNFVNYMTLRDLIHQSDITHTYIFINNKDNSYEGRPHVSITQTIIAYSAVLNELLSLEMTKAYRYKFLVEEVTDLIDKTSYVDVSLLNPRYVAPTPGLKPWGGGRGKKVPPGYYNCNLAKHNRRFAIGPISWSTLIDTPVINRTSYCNEYVLGEILWELTFYGWSSKKVAMTWKTISDRLSKAKKEVKKGKCIEFPSAEGRYKVVIPESVQKQLEDIGGTDWSGSLKKS